MNVRTFEIHDVAVATSKFEVATAKTLKFELSNIHNLLRVVRFCCRDFLTGMQTCSCCYQHERGDQASDKEVDHVPVLSY
jgi:hypothetical protein